MKKRLFVGALITLLTVSLGACNNNTNPESSKGSIEPSSSEEAPKKKIEFSSVLLREENSKAYVVASGKQTNYTEDEFVWTWGLLDQSEDKFIDGKETPAAADFQKVSFNASGSFTVKYCLTDIQDMKSGTLYRVYGGTPSSYGDIEFPTNQTGASDATRKYYLRSDQSNSLVFDNIQPISFTKASVVEVLQANLPSGVTTPGAYVKFGGANSKNLTMDTINGWNEAGKIAGNFQRVIGDGYQIHDHVPEERFWKIEGNEVYFYCYVGFIAEAEGWMVHFDLVSGNSTANFQLDTTLNGETTYTVGNASYKVYADKNKGGEENYWGGLGVYRVAA